MTFPAVPSGLDVELNVNGWTSVRSRLNHGPVQIARGHPDESVTVSPSTLAFTAWNGDGALSPENPLGPYYPWLSQNVPCRVSLPAQANYLRLEGDAVSGATCPDAAGLHITGDIDIRVDVDISGQQRNPGGFFNNILAAKYGGDSSANNSWYFQLGVAGLEFGWSPDGTTIHSAASTIPQPYRGRQCLRVTLQVSTGIVTFYTGPAGGADGSTWTQLGAAVSTGFTSTSIFAGTAAVSAGYFPFNPGNTGSANGAWYELEVRNGIAGTVAAHPVFSSQSAGVASFTDAQSNTWTVRGTASVSSRLYRGHFEVAELPAEEPPYNPVADETAGETDVLSAFAGGGLLRRLSQRNGPLNSAMYRAWVRVQSSLLAAYWPMEDGANAAQFASGSGGRPMFFSGTPTLASNSDFACSNPLPVINKANTNGQVQYSGTWTDNQVAFLMEVPSGGEPNNTAICTVRTTGNIAAFVLFYGTGGTLTLTGYDAGGSPLFTSGAVAFNVNGQKMLISIALQNTPGGGSMTYHIDSFTVGGTQVGTSATFGGSPGAVTSVQLNPGGPAGLVSTVLGHCAVLTAYQQLYSIDTYTNPLGLLTGALNAWGGEPAAIRFARLCSEEGIPYRVTGPVNSTMLMGPQTAQTLTQLLQECADADRGIWYELRQALGWGYVCRPALYNQSPQVTADYTQDYLSPWKSPPLRDDQVIVNDVTITQAAATGAAGSSSRAYAAPGQAVPGGRLSTLTPASGGAGIYDQAYNVNAYQASDLDSLASWIVHIGTVDRRRFPGIALDLANSALSTAQFWAALALDLGQMIKIVNPPPWLGYDTVSQLAQQLTETLDAFTIEIAIAGVPESPYEVLTIGAGHIDTDGTTLGGAVSSGATSLAFVTASGFPVWTTAQADLPLDVMIAGERITVTDISGPPANFLTGQNAGFEGGTGTWTSGTNDSIAASSAQAHSGTSSLALTSAAAGSMDASSCTAATIAANGLPCSAGDTIVCSAWFRAAVSARNCLVGAGFYTSGGVSISTLTGSQVTDSASAWTAKATATLTAPATTAFCRLFVQVLATGAANEVHYADDCFIGDLTTGSALTQTAVVTRSVNGVVKAQASGASVNVYPAVAIGL